MNDSLTTLVKSTPTSEETSAVRPIKLIVLGILSLLGYFYLAWLGGENLAPRSNEDWAITRFLQIYAFLFVCYWLLISPLVRGVRMSSRHLWIAILFALLFRGVMVPSGLILENDIYRYMWDGHMQNEGINPFRYAPSESDVAPYRTWYWSSINYSYIPTIYPPTLQFVFRLSDMLFPGSVLGMKFILVLFDCGTIFLLLCLLKHLKRPPEWALIYAWSPLVLKEIANSGHADAVSAFFFVGFMVLLVKRSLITSAVVMALMTLTKFFGFFLLPLLHRHWGKREYSVYGVVIALMYLPFLALGVNPLKGFLTYSKEWRFNAGVYEWVATFLSSRGGTLSLHSDEYARFALFGVIVLVIAWNAVMMVKRKETTDILRAMYVVIGTLLLCSPVIDPWYFVWIVPLVAVFPNRAWLLLSGTVFLSYTYYYSSHFEPWVKWTEFGVFFVLFLFDGLFPKWRWGIVSQRTVSEKPEPQEPNNYVI